MVKVGLDKAECDTGPLKAEPTSEALWDKMAEPLSTTPHCWPSPSKGEGMSSAGRLLQLGLPWRGPPGLSAAHIACSWQPVLLEGGSDARQRQDGGLCISTSTADKNEKSKTNMQ